MKYAPYRREEALPKLKKECFPKEFLFIDTETKPDYITHEMWYNTFYLGVAIYVMLDKNADIKKREVYRFNSVADLLLLMAEIMHKKKRLVIVGHNIAFDIEVLNLPAVFSELGCFHTYPIRNGMTFIWSVKTGTGNLLFIDTANYATTSLAKVGKDLGNPKMEIDFNTCTDEELFIYCENDCVITELFILEYIRFLIHENMGEFKTTIASQALTAFRHRFMKIAPVFHNNDKVNEIEKYAYFGGRTEALHIGKIPVDMVYNLDVSSEYPAAMIASKLPYQMIKYNDAVLSSVFDFHLKHNYMIVDCLIDTDIPVFPLRAKITTPDDTLRVEVQQSYINTQTNHKIIYPIGTYRTWLHQAELIYALEHNLVKHIYAYVAYKATDLFTDYVNTLFEYKRKYSEEGKEGFRYVTKILLNSLYGKWGQEYHDTKFIANVPLDHEMITYGYSEKYGYNYTDINWFGKLYRTYQTGLSTYSFPAIAGAITSNARMIIWKYREIAGHDNVYYMDTDSLFTNEAGYQRLRDYIKPDTLGMLELKETTTDAIIFGNKDYVFAGNTTHKGVGKNAEITPEGKWRFLHFQGFNSWRNKGANNPPVSEYLEKSRTMLYDKGMLMESGSVAPFALTFPEVSVEYPLYQSRKLYCQIVEPLVQLFR